MNFITEDQFLDIVKKERGEMSLRQFAKVLRNKVSVQFLGNVIIGNKRPGEKLGKLLGYEQVSGYRKLEAKPDKARAKKARAKPEPATAENK